MTPNHSFHRRSDVPTDAKKDLVLTSDRFTAQLDAAVQPEDVIDLGAPQRLRRNPPEELFVTRAPHKRYTYTPNPRLYPAPLVKSKRTNNAPKPPVETNRKEIRRRRQKRTFSRPVPNSRLYRPLPRRPVPVIPPARPRGSWPPPAAPASHLDTASRAALRFTEQIKPARCSTKHQEWSQIPVSLVEERSQVRPASRRLVVTLPGAGGGDIGETPAGTSPYRPTSAHFRSRTADALEHSVSMDAAATSQHSASPEDRSDGNETLSAPSEFLAEFLSAIMQRQYAEALKYCRLILQYEPDNSTARGFYPLLRHKLHGSDKHGVEAPRDNSSSESARSPRGFAVLPKVSPPVLASQEDMEQEADESVSEVPGGSRSRTRSSGSCGSQSSLEMDSSEVLVNSSPSHSPSLSRRTEHTDSERSTGASVGSLGSSGSTVSRDACRRCRAPDTDDNGNEHDAQDDHAHSDDLENDNTPAVTSRDLKKESSSLRRLRAHFACSIK